MPKGNRQAPWLIGGAKKEFPRSRSLFEPQFPLGNPLFRTAVRATKSKPGRAEKKDFLASLFLDGKVIGNNKMARETGVVTRINGSRAMVKTQRSAACEGCSEKSTCHSMGGAKNMEIEALNPVQARTGDTVTLEFATGRMLKLSLLLYIFPIVALLVGAIIGDQTAKSAGMDASVLAAITGFAGFLLAMAAILALEKKARNSDKYKPTIISARRNNDARQGDREVEKCGLCH